MIAGYTFHGCRAITSITIPGNITSIFEDAFSACSSLRDVTIAEGTEFIGFRAFANCGALRNIYIPKSVTSIGQRPDTDSESLLFMFMPQETKGKDFRVFEGDIHLKITTPSGSCAQQYAKDCGIPFIAE